MCAFEKDWASFCTSVEETRVFLNKAIGIWLEYNQSFSSFKNILTDVNGIVSQDDEDKIDHESVKHMLNRYQVNELFLSG